MAEIVVFVLSFNCSGLVVGGPQAPGTTERVRANQPADRDGVIVQARGVVESATYVDIRSEVDGRILSVAPEGTVKKGDLLVELDSSEFEDRVTRQQILCEQARAKMIQAERKREATVLDFEVGTEALERRLVLAELALKRYVGDGGEHDVELRAAEGEVKIAEKRLSIAEKRLAYLKAQQDVVPAAEIEEAELAALESKTALEMSRAQLNLLRKYQHAYRQAELKADLDEIKSELARAKHERAQTLIQAKAEVAASEVAFEMEMVRLKRFEQDLRACCIHAPQDGVILHANVGGPPSGVEFRLEAGVLVRERQPLIRYPDLDQLRLRAFVPGTEIVRVRVGQPVAVTIDAFPGRQFNGRVTQVSREAEASDWPNRRPQQFAVLVSIATPPEGARPGMTGEAKIDVSQASNARSGR